MNKKLVTVIILNYNGANYIKHCLDSIRNQTYRDMEVIVVDNASIDGSADHVRKKYPWVRVLYNGKNLGFAKGNNIGAQHGKGAYLIFLNNDTIVDQRWMEHLVMAADSSEAVGICGSKILDMEKRNIIQEVGGLCDMYGFSLSRGFGEIDSSQYDKINEVFYVSGASLLIKRAVADKIGLFDSEYFFNQEDVDLCWRTWLSGYKVLVNPFSIVYHKGGGAAAGAPGSNTNCIESDYRTSAWRRYHAEKNILRTLVKNYSISTLCGTMPLFWALYLSEILLYVATGRLNAAESYVKALVWNMRNVTSTWQERRKIQALRKIGDGEIRSKMIKGSGKLKRFRQIGIPIFD
jgi:GT2 family glycosyltransferase